REHSGFIICTPGNFTSTTLSNNTSLTIASVQLNPASLALQQYQAVRGGLSVNVPVTSSDTAVGTITTSPVVFGGGDNFVSTAFHPVGVGTANVTVGTPAGFSTPSTNQQITATVP